MELFSIKDTVSYLHTKKELDHLKKKCTNRFANQKRGRQKNAHTPPALWSSHGLRSGCHSFRRSSLRVSRVPILQVVSSWPVPTVGGWVSRRQRLRLLGAVCTKGLDPSLSGSWTASCWLWSELTHCVLYRKLPGVSRKGVGPPLSL